MRSVSPQNAAWLSASVRAGDHHSTQTKQLGGMGKHAMAETEVEFAGRAEGAGGSRLLVLDRARRVGRQVILACATATLVAGCNQSTSHSALLPIDTVAMQSTVERLAKEMLVPGAVVILRTPAGDFTTAYGVTTYHGSMPTSFDQHVRVGSNTKTWMGTVILQHIQEGRLKLDDPVSKYRPDVPNGEHITIEQLLTMRSGLHNYSTTLELNQALDAQPLKVWTQSELLALGYTDSPDFAPGAEFGYSNTNTVLLGLIAEQIEGGKPLAAIMRDRLFSPLGLNPHAVSRHRIECDSHAVLARLHVRQQCADDGHAPRVAGRHAGRRPRGHARSWRPDRRESVVGLGGRRRHLHRQRPRCLGAGFSQRGAAECRFANSATRERAADRPE